MKVLIRDEETIKTFISYLYMFGKDINLKSGQKQINSLISNIYPEKGVFTLKSQISDNEDSEQVFETAAFSHSGKYYTFGIRQNDLMQYIIPDEIYESDIRSAPRGRIKTEKTFYLNIVYNNGETKQISAVLYDYSPFSFSFLIKDKKQLSSLKEINKIMLSANRSEIYEHNLKVIRSYNFEDDFFIVLSYTESSGYSHSFNKEFDTNINLNFINPVNNKKTYAELIQMKADLFKIKISKNNDPVFLRGMLIPDAQIYIHGYGQHKINLMVESTEYRNDHYLIARVTDFNELFFQHLCAYIYSQKEKNIFLANSGDLNDLMIFFIKSGFFYTKKQKLLRNRIHSTFQTMSVIYDKNCTLLNSIICRKQDKIISHMSLSKVYEHTWNSQHHASIPGEDIKANFDVLFCLLELYIDERVNRLINSKYVTCYYRPENRYPDFIFGGFYRYCKNEELCCIIKFNHYLIKDLADYKMDICKLDDKNKIYEIKPGNHKIISVMQNFLKETSPGLFIESNQLKGDQFFLDSVGEIYKSYGLYRERKFVGLFENNRLIAFTGLELSSVGLNFSDLTNSIKLYIIDKDCMDRNKIKNLILQSVYIYKNKGYSQLSLLLDPNEDFFDAREMGFDFNKLYNYWIIDNSVIAEATEYTKRKVKYVG